MMKGKTLLFNRKIVLAFSAAVLTFTLTGCVEPPIDIPVSATNSPAATALTVPDAEENVLKATEPVSEADQAMCDTVKTAVLLFDSTDDNGTSNEARLSNLSQLNETLNDSATVFESDDLNDNLTSLKNATTNYYSNTLDEANSDPTRSATGVLNAKLQHQGASTQFIRNCR